MENESISEKFQSKFSELLEKEGKKLGQYVLIFLVLIAAFLYFFFFKEEKKNPQNHLDTSLYALSHASTEELPLTFATFETTLNKNLNFAPNYQGRAVQILLEKSDPQDAALLLKTLFNRVSMESYPHFKTFSEITFEIAEGNLSQALKQSEELKTRLSDQPVLYAHNLVRMAFLQKLLKDPDLHTTTDEINTILTTQNSPLKESLQELEEIYRYKNLGLIQFFDTQDL